MATISSPGIGSGLDVKSIVAQLVALERQPLTKLQVQAATVQTKISAFGEVKSLISKLSDAASKLASLTAFNVVSATSSNTAAVTASAVGGTLPTAFNVEVQGLAKAQATASAALLPIGGALGPGTLRLELGQWSVGAATFTPGSGTPVDVTIVATDTVSTIASKINGANAGVTATVLTDASGERLLLQSKNTGDLAGFRLTTTDDDGNNTDNAGLSRLVFGSTMTTQGADAKATVNGIAVTSATNTFATSVSGVTFNALQVTTAPVTVTVSQDKAAIRKSVDEFVTAYNAVNKYLSEATKYDAATKTAGLFQGDSTALGLQNALRGVLQSATAGSAFQRLADIGITQQRGGDLLVDSTKFTASLDKLEDVKKLFINSGTNPLTDGVAVKFKALTKGLLATGGFFSSKDAALNRSLERNSDDQDRLNEKVARIEAQLNRRYSALDVQLSSLNALNAYVAQQVTAWNKTTS